MVVNVHCHQCKGKGNCIWFKTRDHYLDLEGDQLKEFSGYLKTHGLCVLEIDRKTLEVSDSKKDIRIILYRHECGPEIIFDFAKELVIAGIVTIVIDSLKKIIERKARKQKEKPEFKVYFFQEVNQIQINSLDENTIRSLIKENKKSLSQRKRLKQK